MRILTKHMVVGPAHDPYGRDITTVIEGDRKIVLYECGLAGTWMELYEGSSKVREVRAREAWQGAPFEQAKCDATKIRLLAKRWIGIEDLHEAAHLQEVFDDPMGSLSDYA